MPKIVLSDMNILENLHSVELLLKSARNAAPVNRLSLEQALFKLGQVQVAIQAKGLRKPEDVVRG